MSTRSQPAGEQRPDEDQAGLELHDGPEGAGRPDRERPVEPAPADREEQEQQRADLAELQRVGDRPRQRRRAGASPSGRSPARAGADPGDEHRHRARRSRARSRSAAGQQPERQHGEDERRRVVEEAEAAGLLDGRVVEALAGEDAVRGLVVGEEVEAERPGRLRGEDASRSTSPRMTRRERGAPSGRRPARAGRRSASNDPVRFGPKSSRGRADPHRPDGPARDRKGVVGSLDGRPIGYGVPHAPTVGWLVLVAFTITVLARRPCVRVRSGDARQRRVELPRGRRALERRAPALCPRPGDRNVPLAPPYWSVPLLAPPPIAVLWRPLALLGEPAMALWAGAGLVVTSRPPQRSSPAAA